MKKNKASFTASLMAYFRAYHAAHDDPKIFDDYLASHLLTEEERTTLDRNLHRAVKIFHYLGSQKAVASVIKFFLPRHVGRTMEAFAPGNFTVTKSQAAALNWYTQAIGGPTLSLSRARYMEDKLEEAVKQGVKQYVILGAGMDTFAFRRPELVEQLQVFEVDHPDTQALKCQRLAELGWEIPKQLHFIPVDFTREKLDEALKHSPYDPQEPGFFSWMGVTYYLTPSEVFNTLRTVADISPKGSTVIFDYMDTDAFNNSKVAPRVQMMIWSAGSVGEKMKTGFDPSTLFKGLAALGLHLKENLSPSEIEERYFRERTDNYHAVEHAHFAFAMVE